MRQNYVSTDDASFFVAWYGSVLVSFVSAAHFRAGQWLRRVRFDDKGSIRWFCQRRFCLALRLELFSIALNLSIL